MVFETLRLVAWKLAERTLVFADWDGFREAALPGSHPGGALAYLARFANLAGRSDAWWWVPYLVMPVALGASLHLLVHGARRFRLMPLWILSALAAEVQQILCSDVGAWLDPEPSFVLMNMLGLVGACAIVGTVRGLARTGGWRGLAAVAAAILFTVPLGLYAVVAAGVLLGYGVKAAGRSRGAAAAWMAGLLLTAAAFPATCRLVYGDLAPTEALAESHGFRTYCGSAASMAPQLRLERHIRAGDFAGALRVEASEFPLRMEIALRILAQFRCNCVLENLFSAPIRTTHLTAGAAQLDLDGHLLLFHYGFMLPARRALYERLVNRGWDPESYRYLGDIAFIRGDLALARRDYMQLARCPGWGDFARRRLAAIEDPAQRGAEDLVPVAALAKYWNDWQSGQDNPFFDQTENVEEYVYNRFRRLRAGSPEMARMSFAAAILCGDAKKLSDNTALLDVLAPPPRPWPQAVQEALVFHEPPGRLVAYRPGAISPETLKRWDAWRLDSTRLKRNALRKRYGDTYWFYRHWTDRPPAPQSL